MLGRGKKNPSLPKKVTQDPDSSPTSKNMPNGHNVDSSGVGKTSTQLQ